MPFVKNLFYFATIMSVQKINQLFSNQTPVKELVNLLKKESANQININGLYGSSKSYCLSSALSAGVHIVIMNNKEDAQYICND